MISLRENIVEVLMNCYDPEIPLDLWSLGLIYDISISNDESPKKKVNIIMSLTTPGCSMGQHMADDIKSKLLTIRIVGAQEINHAPENISWISPLAKSLMGRSVGDIVNVETTKDERSYSVLEVYY